MKGICAIPAFIVFAFVLSLTAPLVSSSSSQLWLQFAHPSNPHPGVNGHITTPELFADANVVVQLPALVVLMEFTNVAHRPQHTVAFWRDLVFGNPRAGIRPSVAEIVRENSNGRLLLVPAAAGDRHGANDGVVGWVASQHGDSTIDEFWDPPETGPAKGRAEGIRVADPFFDYFLYDSNNDKLITANELAVVVVFPNGFSCDQHIGHPNPPGCTGHSGGKVTPTYPAQVAVDGNTGFPVSVSQQVAGVQEISRVGVVAHELGHSVLGLGDLYEIAQGITCPTKVTVWDGYICDGVWYPPRPGIYTFMDNPAPSSGFVHHLDPWAKIHLGFVKPLVVTHDGIYTLFDAETLRNFSVQATQPEALIIYDPLRADPYKEYFILENRNITGAPAWNQDQGLAVWLINEDVPKWPYGLNLRKVVRLIRRGGHDVGDNVSLWDGVEGYDLTPTSTPRNTNWTDGSPSYIEIYDISQAGPSMTFKVRMSPIFVDWSNTGLENGLQANPFNTVFEGVSAITDPPRTIRIAGGSYPETLVINTPCTLMGWRNGNAAIGQ